MREGPFANWQVNGNAFLQRDAGREGIDLISEKNLKDLENKITNCKLEVSTFRAFYIVFRY